LNRKQLIIQNKCIESPRRKPLIIRGARQVGKSTLVRLFASHNGAEIAEINLERYPELDSTFAKMDTSSLIDVLEALPAMPEISAETLLFLDEIQAVPSAIPALRYLYEDKPELPVVAAGSLLEFSLSDHTYSMPVGRVEYLHLGPMTFSEFLEALGETKLLKILKQFQLQQTVNPIVHNRLLSLLRSFCFVGGMPEAIHAYTASHNLRAAQEVHLSILDTYREDFPKYIGSRSLARVQHVFNYAARHVGQKVKYSNYSKEDKTAIKRDIELLCMARVLSPIFHCHCNGLPLQAEIQEKVYKLLFLDVGLMNTLCGLNWRSFSERDDVQLVNEGAVAEQFIGQHLLDLLANSPNRMLNYWLREGRSNNAEIDYVIALGGQIVPIEVKSGGSGTLKSLHQFMGEKTAPLAVRFDANPPSLQQVEAIIHKDGARETVTYDLLSLPLYMVEWLPEILAQALDTSTQRVFKTES
jgi:predicted AAA+ superfamily ATPase